MYEAKQHAPTAAAAASMVVDDVDAIVLITF